MNPNENLTPEKIQAFSPFPWRYVVINNGQVVVVDNRNNEVPIFSLVALATHHTRLVVEGKVPA